MERNRCQENRGIMGQRHFMLRKSLDIRFTDYPLDQGKEHVPFPAFPAWAVGQGTGPLQVHRAEPYAPGGSICDTQK